MPRTRLRKKNEETSLKLSSSKFTKEEDINKKDVLLLIEQLENELKNRKKKLEHEYKDLVDKIKSPFRKIDLLIGKSNFSKTVSQLREESFASTIYNSFVGNSKYNSSDEGYLTESLESHLPKTVMMPTANKEVLMSSMLNNTTSTAKYTDVQTSKFKTPAPMNNGVNPALTFGYVTPKVQPNKPLTVLRRPKQGELVISMSGSPLLVTSVITEEKPNINIPLPDGRIVSVQPHAGMRLSEIPEIDNEIKTDLRILQKNLSAFMKK